MQLAEKKNCWLAEVEDLPANELELWMAYYDIKATNEKLAKRQAETSANLSGKR